MPEGSELTGGTDGGVLTGVTQPDGTVTYTLTGSDLQGLTMRPPADSSDDFQLTVTATATEITGATATSTSTMNVAVTTVADVADVATESVVTAEDTAAALTIDTAVTDTDGSEVITAVTVSDIPPGAALSLAAGSGLTLTVSEDGLSATVTGSGVNAAGRPDGSFTAEDLASLQGGAVLVTPPEDSSIDFTLQVNSTSTDTDPDVTAVIEALVDTADAAQAAADGLASASVAAAQQATSSQAAADQAAADLAAAQTDLTAATEAFDAAQAAAESRSR